MDQPDAPLTIIPRLPAKSARRFFQPVFGYLLAAAGLVWVFYDIRVEKLWHTLPAIDWWWVVPAVVCDTLSYVCQGLRWQLLLRPVGTLPIGRATQAVYAGLFTNEILPMRIGEFVRAYLVSRWISAEFATVIPSIVVERLLDGVWLALAIGLTAIFIPLPKDLLEAGDFLGIIILAATGFFLYLIYRRRNVPADHWGLSPGWKPVRVLLSMAGRLADGLRKIGTSRFLAGAAGVSLLMFLFQALAFWLVMIAYGFQQSFWVGAVVFLIVHLGTALPNAPSNVGTYQFFTVVGLTLFGVEKTAATGFSVVVFLILTVPLWLIGSFALSRSGTTLSAIRSEIKRLLSAVRK